MIEQIAPRPKTLLWDLDGTLLDSYAVHEKILLEVLPGFNRVMPPPEVLAQNYHGILEDSISNTLGGAASTQELAAIIQAYLVVQDRHYETIEHYLLEDALSLARQARAAGLRQLLVTNRGHVGRLRASPRYIVEHTSLKDLIDTIICGDDSEHHKPNPKVLGALLESINPKETLVIGDQHVDAELAYNLGARAVLVCRNGNDGAAVLNRLRPGYQSYVSVVQSLNDVRI